MNKHEISWDEWIKKLSTCSYGEVDYSGLSEQSAKANNPNLYEYYKYGYKAEDVINNHLMIDEEDGTAIWLDLDDPDCFNTKQLDAILSNTKFYQTFSLEISNLRVLNEIKDVEVKVLDTLKKQIFVGAITCLETYLSDAFINTVLSDQEYLKSFYASSIDFKKQKLTMNELFNTVEKAEEIAKNKMSDVLYHNIPKVSRMFKETLNISFPNFAKIAQYVSIRHDIVHRNGQNKKSGNQITIDTETINNLIYEIEDFINKIDKKIEEKNRIRQFQKVAEELDIVI